MMKTTNETPALERILLHENLAEQARIKQEIQTRAAILNRLEGMEREEIAMITSSQESIDKYIHKKLLQENETFRQLNDSGIEGIKATLSPELTSLRFSLEAWRAIRMPNKFQSKFENVVFKHKSWEVDEEAVEELFIRSHLKVYIQGVAIAEYKRLLSIVEYLEAHRCPNNQVVASSFLNLRIEPVGPFKFKPRWQYFMRDTA